MPRSCRIPKADWSGIGAAAEELDNGVSESLAAAIAGEHVRHRLPDRAHRWCDAARRAVRDHRQHPRPTDGSNRRGLTPFDDRRGNGRRRRAGARRGDAADPGEFHLRPGGSPQGCRRIGPSRRLINRAGHIRSSASDVRPRTRKYLSTEHRGLSKRRENGDARLDDAARAGWLYYIAGNTQDEIATKLGISRQSAQRLVALAVSEGLVKVRLDHPIARCLDLAGRLKTRFALATCRSRADRSGVGLHHPRASPTPPRSRSSGGCGRRASAIIAIGTGRTLKAAIELLPPIDAPDKKIVSLTGNIAPDGSAAFYSVIFTMADVVKARHFPMSLPVIASSARRARPAAQPADDPCDARPCSQADIAFVGVGDLGPMRRCTRMVLSRAPS